MENNVKKPRSYIHLILLIILIIALIVTIFFAEKFWGARISIHQKSDTHPLPVTSGTNYAVLDSFAVTKASEYQFHLSWLPSGKQVKDLQSIPLTDLGAITIFVLTNSKNEVIEAFSGGALTYSASLFLEPDSYTLNGYFATDPDSFKNLTEQYVCSKNEAESMTRNIDFSSLSTDRNIDMSLSLKITATHKYHLFLFAFIILGLLTGTCFVFLFIILRTKGLRLEPEKFDERQELERGRGFRYGFFTFLILNFLTIFVECVFSLQGTETYKIQCTCLILAVAVAVIYFIWHESFFALNQKPVATLILFAFCALVNLFFVIYAAANGQLIQNGQFTEKYLNLCCFFLFLALFIAMLAKRIQIKRKKDFSEEDE